MAHSSLKADRLQIPPPQIYIYIYFFFSSSSQFNSEDQKRGMSSSCSQAEGVSSYSAFCANKVFLQLIGWAPPTLRRTIVFIHFADSPLISSTKILMPNQSSLAKYLGTLGPVKFIDKISCHINSF